LKQIEAEKVANCNEIRPECFKDLDRQSIFG